MLSFLLISVNSKLKGKFIQKFEESSATRSIYGHSTCYSPKMDVLFVGAEYQNVTQEGEESETFRMGAIYIYKYNSDQSKYVLIQTLYPPTDKFLQSEATQTVEKALHGWAEVRQMGSLLTVSEDGKQLITGCPYSNTYRQDDNGSIVITIQGQTMRFEKLEEVGCALSFEYNEQTGLWEFTHIFFPEPEDMLAKNGLGRRGRLSPSGNTLCLGYYNKKLAQRNTQGRVFTVQYDASSRSWGELEEAPLPDNLQAFFTDPKYLPYINYGSSIEFLSETTFYVAVQVYSDLKSIIGTNSYPGIQIFNYDSQTGKWKWFEDILPLDAENEKWNEYGTTIQLAGSGTSQILAVSLEDDSGTNKMIILQNKYSGFSKDYSQIFSFGKNFTSFDFYLGSADMFISSGASYTESKQANANGAIRVYQMNDDKKYVSVLDALIPPKKDRLIELFNFGCSITWKDKNYVFVGAHHKEPGTGLPLDNPAVYLVELDSDNSKRNAIIIGCVISGAVVIAAVIVVIVMLARKKKNVDINQKITQSNDCYV